jgi:hypothetical protein
MSKPYAEIDWQSHDGRRPYARICEGPTKAAPPVLCLHGLTLDDFPRRVP